MLILENGAQVAEPKIVRPQYKTCEWFEALPPPTPLDIEDGERQFGVPASVLVSYGARRRHDGIWAWPMYRSSVGPPYGIRYRASDGRKWSEAGASSGIFVPKRIPDGAPRILFVDEGPTSTMALAGVGLWAVGRAACNQTDDLVERYVRGTQCEHVVIMANNDTAKPNPGAINGVTYPGQEGAAGLAMRIRFAVRTCRIVLPMEGKDSRDWIRAGATRNDILQIARNVPTIPMSGSFSIPGCPDGRVLSENGVVSLPEGPPDGSSLRW